jgi:hypothetical protein
MIDSHQNKQKSSPLSHLDKTWRILFSFDKVNSLSSRLDLSRQTSIYLVTFVLVSIFMAELFYRLTQLPVDAKPAAQAAKAGSVYPQFRSSYGSIRWIPAQMPLKVYIAPGLSLDAIQNEETAAPLVNIQNLNNWPDIIAQVLENDQLAASLAPAQGYTEEQYKAVIDGINLWKPLQAEGLFSYEIVGSPEQADVYVFFVHHFVDQMGMALFAGDIRGYTAKRSFPLKAIQAGGKADFKPVLIILRTTDQNGNSMPYIKMRAAAAHEFGHALGIEGHSTNPNDLMSVYYGQGILSANDIATIRYLYHLQPDLIP